MNEGRGGMRGGKYAIYLQYMGHCKEEEKHKAFFWCDLFIFTY